MKLSNKSFLALTALLSVVILQSCGDNSSPYVISFDPPPAYNQDLAVSDTTFENGLHIYTIAKGSGKFEVVNNGGIVVRYTGRRKNDGKVFSSSYYENSTSTTTPLTDLTPSNQNSQSPASIKGFRLGIRGMKKGEKRTIVIPPSLGTSGLNRYNLSGKTLVFDVELVSFY